jgi:putative N-acetylmannosamine-6-phosphate epimerase
LKVKRIVNSYKGFIQKINTPFNEAGYQVLYINTFNEMLEIRDTLQLPILMYENEDRTRSVFMIPTSTELLYVFDIKVDNYDVIYSDASEEAFIENVEK